MHPPLHRKFLIFVNRYQGATIFLPFCIRRTYVDIPGATLFLPFYVRLEYAKEIFVNNINGIERMVLK